MPAGVADLARAGEVDAASVQPVAKAVIGVAVKAGQPLPPLATVEDFKQAVLRAHKVAYIDPASGGCSGIYLDGLFKRPGAWVLPTRWRPRPCWCLVATRQSAWLRARPTWPFTG